MVGQGGALGKAGGARGVLDVDRVVGVQPVGHRPQLGGRHCLTVGDQSIPSGLTEIDHLAQLRAVGGHLLDHRPVVAAFVLDGGEQHADLGLSKHVGQLVAAVGRVDVDQDHADPGGGVLHQHPVHAVRGPDAHPVADPRRTREQAAGQVVDRGVELGIAQPAAGAVLDHRVPVRMAGGGARQVRSDGVTEQGCRRGAAGVGGRNGRTRLRSGHGRIQLAGRYRRQRTVSVAIPASTLNA